MSWRKQRKVQNFCPNKKRKLQKLIKMVLKVLKSINSMRFMATLLTKVVGNLVEGIPKI